MFYLTLDGAQSAQTYPPESYPPESYPTPGVESYPTPGVVFNNPTAGVEPYPSQAPPSYNVLNSPKAPDPQTVQVSCASHYELL